MTKDENDVADEALVSVVICVYNAGDYLLPSVRSILAQTYRNLEVIVVDDGSTDGCMSTISSLRDPRIRIFSQPNRGKSVALNRALSELRGEFYAVQDADDQSYPRRIEKQVECMRKHPGTAAVFCGHELILNGRHVAPTFSAKDEEACRRDIERMRMPAHDPTAMYRMSLVQGLQYDEGLRLSEGYDYIMRVGEEFPMRVLGECLYSYRIHAEAITKRDPAHREQTVREAHRKVLQRRGLPYEEMEPAKDLRSRRLKNKQRDNNIVAHFMNSTVDLRREGRWRAALHTASVCSSMHPRDPYYYRPAVYAIAPLPLVEWYRARKSAR